MNNMYTLVEPPRPLHMISQRRTDMINVQFPLLSVVLFVYLNLTRKADKQ